MVPLPDHIRRRRRLGAVLVLAAAVALGWLVLGGGSGSHPYQLGGGSPPAVLSTPVTRGPQRRPDKGHPSVFKAAPAAIALAGSLPLERQVAQLFMVTLTGTNPVAAASSGLPDWGGVVLGSANFRNDAQIAALAAGIATAARGARHLAPLLAAPQEGGPATAFPDLPPEPETAIGADGRPELARAQAQLAARRLRALGFNMTLAPLADVDTTGGALSGRLYGTDANTVASLSAAALGGYNAAGLISAPGHFPGEGGASADPDQMTATVGGSLAQLRARDLVPFAALAPTAPVIMLSNALFAAFDGVTPADLLKPAVDLLRRDDGFAGVVMSDDLDAALQATGGDVGAAAIAALKAGDDLLYISGAPAEQRSAYMAVLAKAQQDMALRKLVSDALLRVLTLKLRFGVVR